MIRTVIAACAAALLVGGAAGAQDYPTRAINIIVPFAAGGPTDTVARLLSPIAPLVNRLRKRNSMIEVVLLGAIQTRTARA